MGDGVRPSPYYYQGKEEEKRTLGQFIGELCAYYMALGMPREQFNDGDRFAFDDYENAFECRQILQNRMLHLQGLYNYRAFGSVLSSAFAPKGKKGEPYLEAPIPITKAERKAEKERNIMRTLQFVYGRKRGGTNGGN